MNNCEIVEDLLILYEEGECSKGSKEFIDEHLKNCEKCRKLKEKLKITNELPSLADKTTENSEAKVMAKSFLKIKRRWIISLVAVLMIIPLVGLGILVRNEYNKEGMCFTNLQEIMLCRKWVKLLEEEKFEEAARLVDYSEDYAGIMEEYERLKKQIEDNEASAEEDMEGFMKLYADVVEMTQEEYEEARVADFVRRLSVYDEEDNKVYYRGFSDAYMTDDGEWSITVKIEENNANYSLATFSVKGDCLYGLSGEQGNSYLIGGILGRVNFESGVQ